MGGWRVTSTVVVSVLVTLALLSIVALLGGFNVVLGAIEQEPAANPTTEAAQPLDPFVPPDIDLSPLPVAEPVEEEPGQTVVSITFDDGWDTQAKAAELLDEHDMRGTFYVNSGSIGQRGYLTLTELREMGAAGHEIGGHTVSHAELDVVQPDEGKRDICLDREVLTSWGFTVRNFAYPFASSTPDVQRIVEECGYNSGRELGMLKNRFDCADCPVAEAIPAENPFLVAAPSQVTDEWTLDDLKAAVEAPGAEGGWVPLTFHRLCSSECNEISVTEDLMEEFLAWLDERTETTDTTVLTVEQVLGGPVQPIQRGPKVPPAEGPNVLKNPGLEEPDTGPEQETRPDLVVPENMPLCWDAESFGDLHSEFTRVPGRDGGTAVSLEVRDITKGEAKLASGKDLGACAPTVVPGETYSLEAWYTSTAPVRFSVAYRLERGVWIYWTSGDFMEPTDKFTRAQWTTPPIPEGVTGLSFGLALEEAGTVVTDDASMAEADPAATPEPEPEQTP